MGRIVDLFLGRDHRIRSAKVFVLPHSYLHRPLSLLYPIECPNEGIDDVGKGNQAMAQSTESTEEKHEAANNIPIDDSNEEAEESTTHGVDSLMPLASSTHPMRKATVAAREKIKEWLSPEESMFVWGVLRTAKIINEDYVIDDGKFLL